MRSALRVALECAVLSFLVYLGQIRGEEKKTSHNAANEVVEPRGSLLDPPMSRYCAVVGERIEDRIDRLETALRLARAELKVNRGTKK